MNADHAADFAQGARIYTQSEWDRLVAERDQARERLATVERLRIVDKTYAAEAESSRDRLAASLRQFVSYADEYPEDIRGPLRDDFLPILRRALSSFGGGGTHE